MSRAKPEDLDEQLQLLAVHHAPKDPLWRRLLRAYQARKRARAAAARADGRIRAAVAAIANGYVAMTDNERARVAALLAGGDVGPQDPWSPAAPPPAAPAEPNDDGPYQGPLELAGEGGESNG